MFAATVVLLAVMMQQLVAGVAYCFRCWAIGAGTLMVLAQAVSGAAGAAIGWRSVWLCCLDSSEGFGPGAARMCNCAVVHEGMCVSL